MDYPATVDVETPERIARWRPLVHWLLAIPHLLLLAILSYVKDLLLFLSWLIILLLGRLPAGIASFQTMVMRYNLRVRTYVGVLHDSYPPWDFDLTSSDPGGSPLVADYSPETTHRKRLTTLIRPVMAIPALLFTILVSILASICQLLGLLGVVVMGRWPAALRSRVVKGMVVSNRFNAYAFLLTDRYPPFSTL